MSESPIPAYAINASTGKVEVNLGHCKQCNHLHFPANRYGCPRCGAGPSSLSIKPTRVPAKLIAVSSLHVPLIKGLNYPMTVGMVEFEDNVLAEVLLLQSSNKYKIGDLVRPLLKPDEVHGSEPMQCFFDLINK